MKVHITAKDTAENSSDHPVFTSTENHCSSDMSTNSRLLYKINVNSGRMIQGLSNSYKSNTKVEFEFINNRMLTFESCLFSHQNTKILQKLR